MRPMPSKGNLGRGMQCEDSCEWWRRIFMHQNQNNDQNIEQIVLIIVYVCFEKKFQGTFVKKSCFGILFASKWRNMVSLNFYFRDQLTLGSIFFIVMIFLSFKKQHNQTKFSLVFSSKSYFKNATSILTSTKTSTKTTKISIHRKENKNKLWKHFLRSWGILLLWRRDLSSCRVQHGCPWLKDSFFRKQN